MHARTHVLSLSCSLACSLSLSLPLSLSCSRSPSLPPSLSLSLEHSEAHTHIHTAAGALRSATAEQLRGGCGLVPPASYRGLLFASGYSGARSSGAYCEAAPRGCPALVPSGSTGDLWLCMLLVRERECVSACLLACLSACLPVCARERARVFTCERCACSGLGVRRMGVQTALPAWLVQAAPRRRCR